MARRPAGEKAWMLRWLGRIALLVVVLFPRRPADVLLPIQTGALFQVPAGALLEIKEAEAAQNPSVDPPAPPPLAWPATSPVVPSDAAGYVPGSGTVTATGEYTYQIPLDIPAGRMDVAPVLSLVYSSRGGNGVLGVGWSLAGASEITRCGKTIAQDGVQDGIDFTTGDSLCLDGRRLVLVSGGAMQDGAEHRTEQDSFSRIAVRCPGAGARSNGGALTSPR